VDDLEGYIRSQIELSEGERMRLGSSFYELERKAWLSARVHTLREILRIINKRNSDAG
jgi:hypothetical protein